MSGWSSRLAARVLVAAGGLALLGPAAAQTPQSVTALDRAKTALAATDYRSAAPLFAQALADADASHDGAASAAALRGLAVAQWGLGDYKDGLQTQARALTLSRERGDLDGERTALNGMGLDHYSLGNYPEALRQYQLALEADTRDPSIKFQGLVWANIGLVYRYQGKFDEAEDAFRTSLDLRRRAADQAGIAQTLNHLGIVSRATGHYERALAFYEQAASARRTMGDRQGEAQTLNNLGNVYLDLGEHERAIELYAAAQRIAEAIGYRLQIALSNENIAQALENLGRNRDALVRTRAALDLYRTLGRRAGVVQALRNVGELQAALGDVPAARTSFGESLELARTLGDPEQEAMTLNQQAILTSSLASSQGQEEFGQALALARKAGARELIASILSDQGHALLADGRLDPAITVLREGAATLNDLRASVTSDAGKVGYLDRRRRVFRDLVSALSRLGRDGEALEAAESGRARAFGDLLAARSITAAGGAAEPLGLLRRALDLDRASEGGDAAPVDAALDALRASSGELASLVSVEAPRIGDIRATATTLHATLVEYVVDEGQIHTWVVDPTGEVHAATADVTADRIDAEARALRQGLDGAGSSPAVTRGLRWFHRTLIAPIAAWLPAAPDDVVVIVPDGALALVPFAAFTDGAGRNLIDRHTIAEAPSLSIFKYTAPKAASASALQSGRALVIAAPTPPAGAAVTDLPGARQEAAAIVAALGSSHVDVLTARAATEARLRRDAGGYAFVHLATHGLISAEHPLASSLVLASGHGEDGYLRVDEVFGMTLRARLVVLSGCSTGLGRLSADGVLGLTRAFIYAGTPAVVVSEWDVSDRATATLMGAFYRAMARGLDPVHALRHAQLDTRRRFAAPGRWAAFVLVGDPR